MSALARAMADTPGVQLQLTTRVTRIQQDDVSVTVTTDRGLFHAAHVVVAVPVNVLPTSPSSHLRRPAQQPPSEPARDSPSRCG